MRSRKNPCDYVQTTFKHALMLPLMNLSFSTIFAEAQISHRNNMGSGGGGGGDFDFRPYRSRGGAFRSVLGPDPDRAAL